MTREGRKAEILAKRLLLALIQMEEFDADPELLFTELAQQVRTNKNLPRGVQGLVTALADHVLGEPA